MKNVKNVSYVRFSNAEVLECQANREKLEELVANSEGFVKYAIKGFYLTGEYSYEDKLQLGYEGFIKAVKKFRADNGADFYTYAYTSIRNHLQNIHSSSKAEKRGYNKEENTYMTVASLDAQANDEEGTNLLSNIVDEDANTFKQAVALDEGLEKIWKILSPSQQYVFREYFLEEKTMKEIAEKHGVTTTRVGNLSKQVVKKIRETFTEAEFAELIGLR